MKSADGSRPDGRSLDGQFDGRRSDGRHGHGGWRGHGDGHGRGDRRGDSHGHGHGRGDRHGHGHGRGGGHDERAAGALPRALGWLSLGLGVAAIAAPRALSRLAGMDDSAAARAVLPAVGARELAHAAVLLGTKRPGRWAWTRVAGDALDLTLLGRAVADRRGERRRRATVATSVVAAISLLDVVAAVRGSRAAGVLRRRIQVEAAITVNRSIGETYRFWRDFENLPRFMYHLESVRVDGPIRSHWVARGPAGRSVEWDAEIVEEQIDRLIAWRSVHQATVPNSGRVRFLTAPGGRGTEVRVELAYAPPAGALGRTVARLLGEEPRQQIRDDLRRFKQVLETGEVVRSDGSPDGLSLRQQLLQRPAQPLASTSRR